MLGLISDSDYLRHSFGSTVWPPLNLQSPLDTVQFELIWDLAAHTYRLTTPRTTGSAPLVDLHILWTVFTLNCFKTKSATPTAHPYRLVTPRTADSASFTDSQCHLLQDLVQRVNGASLSYFYTVNGRLCIIERIPVVSLRPERPILDPSSTLKAIWTPFNLTCIKIPNINGTYLSSHPTLNDRLYTLHRPSRPLAGRH
ncbi:hypothetical protein C8R46DRAFT_1219784 [Mycena filopes]|nr:hypothetical protein C8R46DRAFT_1219784 [Mycena filopes]